MPYSFLIQGPYINTTSSLIRALRIISPNEDIILSCYDEEIDPYLPKICKIVRSKDPGTINTPPRNRPLNLNRQATTIFNGCKFIHTEWVLKIRSDLYINDARKFKDFLTQSTYAIKNDSYLKLIVVNTGSFDVFSYYQMPLHFNDWIFFAKTKSLTSNTHKLSEVDEQAIIGFDEITPPDNYRHKEKYYLRFHIEQLIHFGDRLLKGSLHKYCCEMNMLSKARHLIWVGKHIVLFDIRRIGIMSSKVGLPSKASHLVSLNPTIVDLHQKVIKSKKIKRRFYLTLLVVEGSIRCNIFRVLKNLKKIYLFISNSTLKNLKWMALRK